MTAVQTGRDRALTDVPRLSRPLLPAVIRSEWTKLRSLRSTSWTLLAAGVAAVALGAVLCVKYVQLYPEQSPDDRIGFDAAAFSLTGVYLAQVALATLGTLVVTSEYSTGMIRCSLAAVPQRRTLLLAKVLVFGAVAFVVSELAALAAFGVGQAILSQQHIGVSLSDPQVARAVAGAGLYLTAVSVFALAIGALLRNTAAALSTFFAVMFAGDVMADLLPTSWRNHVINYLPTNASTQAFTVHPSHDALSPAAGLLVLWLYPLAALAVAFLIADRRDS